MLRIGKKPLRVKAHGRVVFFRPPEHDLDRLTVMGISRLGGGRTGICISLPIKSVDRYEGKRADRFSSI